MPNFFEKTIEFISMVQVALFPIVVFLVIGSICYCYLDAPANLIVAILSIIVGLILGVWYAIYIHKKRGATEFLSRISATPELDEKEKK